MELTWTTILFLLLVIDSLGAVAIAWFGRRWWLTVTGQWGRYFPPAKGWAVLYFLLVVLLGYTMGIY